MQAGYFRWEPSSSNVKKLNALACKDFGIELVFFGPDDVDMEKEQIHGEVYQDNIWQKKTVPIPSLINNTPFKSKNERLFNFLGDRAHFMFQSFGGKRKEYKILKDEKTLEDVLIANVRIKNIQHVQDFIAEHGKVIFKPLQKKNQQMMFTLEKQNNEYILEDGKQKSKLAASQLKNVYDELIRGKGLEMAPFIHSKTSSGLPFCVRIDMEKNEEGKWIRAQNYVNIGFNHTFSSSATFGSGSVKTKAFLKANFAADKVKLVDKEIKNIARQLPRILEKELDVAINSVGLDLGIDQEGNVYLLEYSTYPDASFAVGQIALLRAGYMSYFLKNETKASIDEE